MRTRRRRRTPNAHSASMMRKGLCAIDVLLLVFLVLLVAVVSLASGFLPPQPARIRRRRRRSTTVRPLRAAVEDGMDDIRGMRAKELKAELQQRRIPTAGVFEKEELVKRLYEARRASSLPAAASAPPSTSNAATVTTTPPSNPNILVGDLFFTSMETGRSIPAFNKENIRIEGVGQPYPTIQIRVEDRFDLTLLLDTACSGFVLRPSIVPKYNLKSYSNAPVTMTGAGGSVSNMGLAQVGSYTFAGGSFGPMPAAVQEIGALPQALDGIIGLSFLQQFPCVELDVLNGKVRLYKKDRQPDIPPGMSVATEGNMSRTRLGIFTADVTLDGRGPVKMLVDTGATSSFLSWRGIAELGLSRSRVQPLANRIGALGSDNVAMQLTHTLPIAESVKFGSTGAGVAPPPANLSFDIGDIAILETQLKADRVVGILGMDLFLQASLIRMSFMGATPRVTLLK